MSYQLCTEVTPECPVEATLYGYRPNLGGNITLLVVFSTCTIAQLVLGLRYRLRAFTFAASVGCLGEAIGYGGRIMMNKNPWSDAGFKTQICCLVLSPSFLAAALYLTIKHLVIFFGPEHSRLKPALYTWVFICCDVGGMLVQAMGGGIAAAATGSLASIGDDLITTGIAIQMATMFVCLCLALDFAWQVRKNHGNRDASRDEVIERQDLPKSFRWYAICCSIAFVTIFIRCVYRIPEMAGGWGNPLMRDQTEFMILDGAMISIAAILMTVAHPGIHFPAIKSQSHHKRSKGQESPTVEDEQHVSEEPKLSTD